MKSFQEAARRVWRLARQANPSAADIAVISLVAALAAAGRLALPWLLGLAFDRSILSQASLPSERFELLLVFAGSIFLVACALFLLGYLQNVLVAAFDEKALRTLRQSIFWQLQRLSKSYYDRTPQGVLLSRLLEETEDVSYLARSAVSTVVMAPVSLALVLAVLVYLHPLLTLLAALPVLLIAPALYAYLRRSGQATDALKGAVERLTAFASEKISGMKVVQLCGQEESEARRFAERQQDRQQASIALARAAARYFPLVTLLAASSLVIVLLYGGQLSLEGRLTGGQLVSFLAYLVFLPAPLGQLSQSQQLLQTVSLSAKRIFEILDIAPEIQDREDAVELGPEVNSLEIRDLAFAYAGGKDVLKGVSLAAHAGERIGIRGPSGSGKSTLAALVVRFYDPHQGEIRFDGRDLRDLRLGSLRGAVALVMQDDVLFSGSLRDNLRYGAPRASLDEQHRAVRAADLEEFVSSLPAGLNTPVGERGVGLSAGERQRLCLARALLREPAVLVLDEATSALDPQTEGRVLENVSAFLPESLIVIFSHRVSALKNCNRIFALEDGKLAPKRQAVFLEDSR